MGERPGVAFEQLRGDTPYTCWVIYNNEESAVVLSVRKDIGISADDEKRFMEGLQFGIDGARGSRRSASTPRSPGRPRPGGGAARRRPGRSRALPAVPAAPGNSGPRDVETPSGRAMGGPASLCE